MSDATTHPMIFISHATADDAIVTDVHDTLEAVTGCPCWADHHDITPGMEWQKEINRGLATGAARAIACANWVTFPN